MRTHQNWRLRGSFPLAGQRLGQLDANCARYCENGDKRKNSFHMINDFPRVAFIPRRIGNFLRAPEYPPMNRLREKGSDAFFGAESNGDLEKGV
jgi:hypothetical protein